MPYIVVEFAGEKTFGGYLRINNGSQIQLMDGLLIKVEPGTHYLSFSSQNSVNRGISKLNAAVGNYNIAAWSERNSVDGDITETLEENDVMLFTVVSDRGGHILSQPRYTIKEFTDEGIKEVDEKYEEQLAMFAENAQKGITTELILCLLLGWLGAHKFYRGKTGMGLLYLISMGLFGIGILFDLIGIIIRMVRK